MLSLDYLLIAALVANIVESSSQSESTSKATGDIEQMIFGVQVDTSSVVAEMNSGLEEVKQGLNRLT